MKTDRIELLANAPVTKAIMVMSLPVVLGMMVQVLYNLVDTFFIGKLGDPNQLAAANLAMPVFILMMALGGMIGTGASSYISRSLGEKKQEQADKTLTIGFFLCVVLGVMVTIVGLLFLKSLVSVLGASSETSGFAVEYVLVLFLGGIPIITNYAMGQLLRAEGDAMGAMFGMFLGTVTNIVLDPIFIFVFGMGVRGAAIATVLGNSISLIYYLMHYAQHKTLLRIDPTLFSFDKTVFREIFSIGVPSSLSQLLMGIALIVLNNIASGYSDIVVAGLGVSTRIISIGTFIFMGFAAGCQPLAGYNYGARNFARVRAVIVQGVIITSTIGVVLSIILGIFAKGITGIFTTNPEVADTAAIILRALIVSLPFVGGQMLSTVTVQAFGKALPALFLSISRQGLFFLPLLLLLNALFGFKGFIYAQPATDVLMFLVSSFTLWHILRKEARKTL
ncbi:MATE family efflux transporter [Sphaerochaeta sp. PS]|uniref:MATE family efflux transporter n=1 Tax=Sphaerochaeta sp. PS TaxID=3076336 RepID=UPI0028A381AE|nr:MATE family efflux transporter [Sphaerochaeta sp. PS]MDT4761139.1 MATE family efflux transporter [Sphaerochaeta sp. PS]